MAVVGGAADVVVIAVALPIAHLGHWYVSLPIFMGPVVALFAYIYIGEWRNKRKERRKSGQ